MDGTRQTDRQADTFGSWRQVIDADYGDGGDYHNDEDGKHYGGGADDVANDDDNDDGDGSDDDDGIYIFRLAREQKSRSTPHRARGAGERRLAIDVPLLRPSARLKAGGNPHGSLQYFGCERGIQRGLNLRAIQQHLVLLIRKTGVKKLPVGAVQQRQTTRHTAAAAGASRGKQTRFLNSNLLRTASAFIGVPGIACNRAEKGKRNSGRNDDEGHSMVGVLRFVGQKVSDQLSSLTPLEPQSRFGDQLLEI